MKAIAATLASLLLIAASGGHAQTKTGPGDKPMFSPEDVRMVAPALERYTQDRLLGEVWKRPGLSPRDRSVVTLSVLITRNQTIEMAYYLNLALDNGVKPSEMSEMITHLAFYSGWGNAMSAVAVVKDVFAQRGIKAGGVPSPSPKALSLGEGGGGATPMSKQQEVGHRGAGGVAIHDPGPVP